VSEEEKHRLMSAAWLLLHPASIEGWGIVVAEAAVRGTPTVGFSVPGVRDSVVHNETGVLVRTEGEFASAWASLAIDDRRRRRWVASRASGPCSCTGRPPSTALAGS
jgi:glycosyltransferase involved in cell wall biosynthesis